MNNFVYKKREWKMCSQILPNKYFLSFSHAYICGFVVERILNKLNMPHALVYICGIKFMGLPGLYSSVIFSLKRGCGFESPPGINKIWRQTFKVKIHTSALLILSVCMYNTMTRHTFLKSIIAYIDASSCSLHFSKELVLEFFSPFIDLTN